MDFDDDNNVPELVSISNDLNGLNENSNYSASERNISGAKVPVTILTGFLGSGS
jgi:hypothetical protein